MRLSFEEIFGDGATQDAEKLVIRLTDIGSFSAAQGILASLFNRILLNGVISGNEQDIQVNGEYLRFNNSTTYDVLNAIYRRKEIRSRNDTNYLTYTYTVKILVPVSELI
jgi:hypothetical protein